ncbi:MAG: hypothetical protein KKH80_03285 [Candidatus Omnitrophica bacterium]|nr:hypothetical protein [Candidatus Omnitrophota bacterium]
MIFYILYKIGEFIALIFPLKMAYMVGIFFSDLHYLFAWKDHANVAANLKAIFPEKSIQEIKAMRLRMSRNFAKYLVDFFRFSRLNKNNIKKFLHTKNLHYIDNALKNGKGAIILTAHIGNWEVGGVGMALLGYDIGVVALSHRHGSVDKFFIAQREQKGVSVLPLAGQRGIA